MVVLTLRVRCIHHAERDVYDVGVGARLNEKRS
jgi:hypothetical protein